jgi:hypothetical protein
VFFIDARAKRSIVESCIYIYYIYNLPANIQNMCVCVCIIDTVCLQTVHRWNRRNKQPEVCTLPLRTSTTASSQKFRSIMILPQVHLRKPCYDFYFL